METIRKAEGYLPEHINQIIHDTTSTGVMVRSSYSDGELQSGYYCRDKFDNVYTGKFDVVEELVGAYKILFLQIDNLNEGSRVPELLKKVSDLKTKFPNLVIDTANIDELVWLRDKLFNRGVIIKTSTPIVDNDFFVPYKEVVDKLKTVDFITAAPLPTEANIKSIANLINNNQKIILEGLITKPSDITGGIAQVIKQTEASDNLYICCSKTFRARKLVKNIYGIK